MNGAREASLDPARGIDGGEAVLGSALAERLGVGQGDDVTVGAQPLRVVVAGDGQSLTVSTALARSLIGDHGWWVVSAPPGQENRRDLAATLGAAVGLPYTADPAVRPDPAGGGLIYDWGALDFAGGLDGYRKAHTVLGWGTEW